MLITWRPTRKFRIVIIGGGAIGDKIAQAIKLLGENVELVAAWCRTIEKANAFAKKHGCVGYSDYEAMLDSVKPDLAIVCTPSGAHMEPALAAIKRRIHVLIEKPIEITRDRIFAIITAAEREKVVVRGIFQKRYSDAFQTLAWAIYSGYFGPPESIEIGEIVPWYRPKSYFFDESGARNWRGTLELDGGGAEMNQGVHGLDQIIYLMSLIPGQSRRHPMSQLSCLACNITPGMSNLVHPYINGEELLTCQFTGHGECRGSLLASTCLGPGFDETLTVKGSKGIVTLRDNAPVVWNFPERTLTVGENRILGTMSQASSATSASANPMAIGATQHADCILDALRAIEGETPLFDLSARKAALSPLTVLAMYDSARNGGALTNPESFLVT